MKVNIQEIREKMKKVLVEKGYGQDDIRFLIEMYLGGELEGHKSHGLASFPGFVKQDFSNLPKPEVIKATNSVFILDAKGNPGSIVGRRAADEAMARAKKEIIVPAC